MNVWSYDGRQLVTGAVVYLHKYTTYSRDSFTGWDWHFSGVRVRVMKCVFNTHNESFFVLTRFQEPKEVWHGRRQAQARRVTQYYKVTCTRLGDDYHNWQAFSYGSFANLDGFPTPMNPIYLSVEKDGRRVDSERILRTLAIRAHVEAINGAR